MQKIVGRKPRRIYFILIVLGICLAGAWGVRNWPAIGSKLASPMRKVLGVERVAQMETLLFEAQDRFNRWKYEAGLAEPEVPWGAAQNLPGDPAFSTQVLPEAVPTASPMPPSAIPAPTNAAMSDPGRQTSAPAKPTAPATPTPSPAAWNLANVKPFGGLAGEGVWQPYIANPAGEVVALRTFLQPDPERPYAVVAVAAFDLRKTDLRFVLGSVEPSLPGGPHGTGLIPPEDKQPGRLLAAFNGGFIAEHGQYGAMGNGVVALAAKPGLATLAIYPDGEVRIGEWAKDLMEGETYTSWRQNAITIIQNGEINPLVYTGTWVEWGANYDFNAVTLRSSIGLSQDNQVLYYFAGPSLLMPPLAEAMAAAGVYNGMLLDINPTHAHFTAIRVVEDRLVAEPLFEEEMNVWVDRYIRDWAYEQDFYYVTAKR
jgi:hypothetical protein